MPISRSSPSSAGWASSTWSTDVESSAFAERLSEGRWRLWALVPILLLVGAVSLFAGAGDSLLDLVGRSPPQADEFDVRRVEFHPGEIRIRVTNPQTDDLTIASVTVDDAVVPFDLDGPATLQRLRSSTIIVRFDWVPDDPIAVGVTSSTGIETVEEIPAAVETPGASVDSFLGYGIIGLLVGLVPVALGLLWLPSLRRAAPNWLAAFMALTAGLLTFLALEALSEALELQALLPSGLGGTGLVLLGMAISYLTLTVLSHRLGASAGGAAGGGAPLGGVALATLVAIGIGLHNFGEGLAIGSSVALGELALGTFLIVGFMIHNVTEGLGIAAPIAEGTRRASFARLAALAAIAGLPAVPGAWLGGFVTSDVLGVIFFAAAAGAALEVVVEVARYVARKAPGGITSPYVLGGFLAGIAVMYVTGIFAG
jgi:zinc transporter, ZIP family